MAYKKEIFARTEASVRTAQKRINELIKIDFVIFKLPYSVLFFVFNSFGFTTITFSSLEKSIIGVTSILSDEL